MLASKCNLSICWQSYLQFDPINKFIYFLIINYTRVTYDEATTSKCNTIMLTERQLSQNADYTLRSDIGDTNCNRKILCLAWQKHIEITPANEMRSRHYDDDIDAEAAAYTGADNVLSPSQQCTSCFVILILPITHRSTSMPKIINKKEWKAWLVERFHKLCVCRCYRDCESRWPLYGNTSQDTNHITSPPVSCHINWVTRSLGRGNWVTSVRDL